MRDNPHSNRLKINVAGLIKGSEKTEKVEAEVNLELKDRRLEVLERGNPFNIDLELEHIPGGIWVKGALKGELELECSRCLEPFLQVFDLQIDEIYHLPIEKEIDSDVHLERGSEEVLEDEYYVVEEGMLDLSHTLTDAILLAFPMKPLCSSECHGICPHCGINLNVEQCNCSEETIDPRLEVLRDFLDREKS